MTKKNPAAVELGRLGGKSKSAAKARASRENGKLGGAQKAPRDVFTVFELRWMFKKGWQMATEEQRAEIRREYNKLHGGKP